MRRILIVDDEPSVREVMASVLMDAGDMVQTAADGHIALEIIDVAPPDLVITGIMMPHLDGWALLDHARERSPTLPVILMSAGDLICATRDVSPGRRRLSRQAFCRRGSDGTRHAPGR